MNLSWNALFISALISLAATAVSSLLNWQLKSRRHGVVPVDDDRRLMYANITATPDHAVLIAERNLRRAQTRDFRKIVENIRRDEQAGIILPSDFNQERPPLVVANCRNCGAPPEPVCSFCGTRNMAFGYVADSPTPGIVAPDFDEVEI